MFPFPIRALDHQLAGKNLVADFSHSGQRAEFTDVLLIRLCFSLTSAPVSVLASKLDEGSNTNPIIALILKALVARFGQAAICGRAILETIFPVSRSDGR